jgi:glyceraldehyde-3-phosphate dehydrogenase (NADP+)
MERAIRAAREAFPHTRSLSSAERHAVLAAIGDGIAARREEFARGIVDEAGKTIRDARAEVDRALLVFSLAAAEARNLGGEVLPLDLNAASRGRVGLTRRFPAGPVGAITPFNFPLNLVAHKVAPALAAGNPVVLKPAERTPLTALRLAEVIAETPWPPGGFNVVVAERAELGEMLATDDRIAVLSFTGSTAVGWRLKGRAVRKRVVLELGGDAAVIVHEDADLGEAAARCVTGAFANAGQVCISVQRIFVHAPVYDAFTERLIEGGRRLRLGDPHDEATDVGPMIGEAAATRVEGLIGDALGRGATALLPGTRRGNLLSPTILTGVDAGAAAVAREEAFGPVVMVEPYADFEEALRRVNDSAFGLQAGVFTRDVGRLFRAFESLDVGGVIGNDVPQYRADNMPYGGEKDSGFGREGIRYAIAEMTVPRLLALNLGSA